MAAGKTPSSPLPCNEMLATLPSSLQATPSNVPLQGSPLSVQEERKVLWGSREVFSSMRVLSSAFSQTVGGYMMEMKIKKRKKL